MPRLLLLLTGVVLLMADYSFAQDSPDPTPVQCQLIRLAVAQYGFAAARRHVLETDGPEAVKTGDKCFTKQTGRGTSSYVPTALGVERRVGGEIAAIVLVALKRDSEAELFHLSTVDSE
jgi:hypothetical protein